MKIEIRDAAALLVNVARDAFLDPTADASVFRFGLRQDGRALECWRGWDVRVVELFNGTDQNAKAAE